MRISLILWWIIISNNKIKFRFSQIWMTLFNKEVTQLRKMTWCIQTCWMMKQINLPSQLRQNNLFRLWWRCQVPQLRRLQNQLNRLLRLTRITTIWRLSINFYSTKTKFKIPRANNKTQIPPTFLTRIWINKILEFKIWLLINKPTKNKSFRKLDLQPKKRIHTRWLMIAMIRIQLSSW